MYLDKKNRILNGNLIDAIRHKLERSDDPHLLAAIATLALDREVSYAPQREGDFLMMYYQVGRSQRDADLAAIKAALDAAVEPPERFLGGVRYAYQEIIALDGRLRLVRRHIEFAGQPASDDVYDVILVRGEKCHVVSYGVEPRFEEEFLADASDSTYAGEPDCTIPRPYVRWELYSQADGTVRGRYETNDDPDAGENGEVVVKEDLKWATANDALSHTGVTRSGQLCDVEVYLDGALIKNERNSSEHQFSHRTVL